MDKINKLEKIIVERYNHFNSWLKEKFGERVLKICIDGSFTCPNRDGSKGYGGCIFCGERGSGEHLSPLDITKQVENYLNGYKKDRAKKFIAYFQNFSNTYADIETLKQRYDASFVSDKIVGIAIATRPDCIDENIAKLLATYTEKYFVWVELGFQTANEKTGKLINRCYTNEDMKRAVDILKRYGINVVVHMMLGLPNETTSDLNQTIDFINNLDIWGLKIHSTYVIKGTKLNELYESGKYTPLTMEEYVKQVCHVISNINKDVIIHRITGDAPKDLLVCPEWNLHKKRVLNAINKCLNDNDIIQGLKQDLFS